MILKTVQYSCLFLLGGVVAASAAPVRVPAVPEGETFLPYLYSGVSYDDNLFRVADEQEALEDVGTTDMSDTVTHYGLGLRMNKPISLQTLRLDAAVERVNYDQFDSLDHTAGNALAAWDWEVGRVLDGTLSHSYTRGISSFTEFEQAERDIREVDVSHFSGGYNFLSAWRIEAGAERRDIEYEEQSFLNRKEDMGFAELRFLTTVNTHVGLRAQFTEADLEPGLTAGGTFVDNDYEEREYSLVVGWESGGKSYLQARAGRTEREQDDPAQSDFTGATGELVHQWQITPMTSLRTSVFRRVNALDYRISSFVVTEGVSLQPAWQITTDTRIVAFLAYARDDFEGEVRTLDGTVISGAEREDEVGSARLTLDYAALTDLHLLLSTEYRDRSSTRPQSEYDFTRVTAELTYAF